MKIFNPVLNNFFNKCILFGEEYSLEPNDNNSDIR